MVLKIVRNICEIIFDPRCIVASIKWEKFSLTSYQMLTSLSKQGINPQTILDVGANVGQFTIASANIYPEALIYSFEPLPDCFSRLKNNTRSYSNVSVSQLALGDEKGNVAFHVNRHSHSSSILPLSENHKKSFPEAEVAEEIKVDVSTLDLELPNLKLESPVLLKIDVQGYESQVLKGAQNVFDKIDLIILESSFKPMYEGELLFLEIIDQMKRYGFSFLRPVGWLESDDTGEIVQMDMLFKNDSR